MRRVLIAFALLLPSSTVLPQEPKTPGRRTIKLVEQAGVVRVQFPVEVTVPLPKEALTNHQAVRLFRVEGQKKVPVAVQVMAGTLTGSAGADPAAVKLVFLADVAAKGTATYEVALEGDKGKTRQSLKVAGQGVGKTIDTGGTVFELDPSSGQLLAFIPKPVSADRLVFVQGKERPIHWNPDVWAPPTEWTHTNKWNRGVSFDPQKHKPDAPPVGDGKSHSFLFQEAEGPLAYRLARWGRMPLLAQVDAGVTYTFYAGAPFLMLQSRVEFRAGMKVNAVRNGELVFSRHQFDTAVWIDKAGKLHTAACYDYADKDKSFKDIAKLPPDVPCLGLANERKGYGIAYVPLGLKNVNRLTGKAADQQAHFYIRDYDEHGKGSPNNFHYFVRPVVIKGNYEPTEVGAGSVYEETSAIVVFPLNKEPAQRYAELMRWQKTLANPLRITVE